MLNKFNHDETISWILKAAVGTLTAVTMIVIAVLAISLFWVEIDRQAILGILGPAINTIIGAFVGLLGGLTLNGNSLGTQHSASQELDSDSEPSVCNCKSSQSD